MLRPGDVIFFGKNNSDFCQAVEKVVSGNDYFHVAIVSDIGTIVEAQPSGVIEYQYLRESIQENVPGYLEVVTPAITAEERRKAAAWARTKVGLGYNDLFAANLLNSEENESYYCSQLITEAFRESNMEWPNHTLNFKDDEGNLIQFWKEYFEKRGGRQVPQGDEGSHPAQIRRSPVFSLFMLISPNSTDLKPPINMRRLESTEFLDIVGTPCNQTEQVIKNENKNAQTTQIDWVVFVHNELQLVPSE